MEFNVMFFFQAEDGIRDIGVTGVQTCALPIWALPDSVVVRTGDGRTRVRSTAVIEMLAGLGGAWRVVGAAIDRKSVAYGKRVDPGGSRIIKKKKEHRPRKQVISRY